MIVRSASEGWDVVFHAAHGLLAQSIALHLSINPKLPYWPLTRVAIGIHDDNKQPFLPDERTYLTDAGAPRDFTHMPLAAKERVLEAQRQIWEATKKHRWIGLLVSVHTDSLYRAESVSNEMERLLDAELHRRTEVLSSLKVGLGELQQSYDWMEWCDRLSLILAGNDVPAMERRIEIITNTRGERFDMHQSKEGLLHVEPWPFRKQEFSLTIEYRSLTQLTYADDAELALALQNATVKIRRFKLSRID